MHFIVVAFLLTPISTPVRVPPPVVRPAVALHPHRVLAPVQSDETYRRRLVVELCEAKPIFCDWLVG